MFVEKRCLLNQLHVNFFMSFIVFFTYGERLDKVSKVGYTTHTSSRVPTIVVLSCNVGRHTCSSVMPSQC